MIKKTLFKVCFASLTILGLIGSTLMHPTITKASSNEISHAWSNKLDPTIFSYDNDELSAHSLVDGSIVVNSCRGALSNFNSQGNLKYQVTHDYGTMCEESFIVHKNIVYFIASVNNGEDVLLTAKNLASNKVLWQRPIEIPCTNFLDFTPSFSIGSNNSIIAAITGYDDDTNCLETSLNAWDATSGHVIFSQMLSGNTLDRTTIKIMPYKNGIALLGEQEVNEVPRIEYYTYAGQKIFEELIHLADLERIGVLRESYREIIHTHTGMVFVPIDGPVGPYSCRGVKRVISFTPKGKTDDEFVASDCMTSGQESFNTAPGDNLIMSLEYKQFDEYGQQHYEGMLRFIKLNKQLKVTATKTIAEETVDDLYITNENTYTQVDSQGRIINVQQYFNTSFTVWGLRVNIYDENLNHLTDPFYTSSLGDETALYAFGYYFAAAPGRIYFITEGCGKAECGEDPYLHALKAPIGLDYPRSEIIKQTGNPKTSYEYSDDTIPSKSRYMALGDSFTSGEGEFRSLIELNGHPYLKGTDGNNYKHYKYEYGIDTRFEKCHISKRAYPYLLAQKMDTPKNKFNMLACSGATTRDVLGLPNIGLSRYYGQFNQFKSYTADAIKDPAKYDSAKTKSFNLLRPGRLPQNSFVSEHKPELITIGIGGNDLGLMGMLANCVTSLSDCPQAKKGPERAAIGGAIQTNYFRLKNTYDKLKNDAPYSKIYAVSYPKITSISGRCGLNTGFLSGNEARLINESIDYLNSIIEQAARDSGIGYLHIQNSFKHNELCSGSAAHYVNGIAFRFEDGGVSVQESFHPTPYGHAKIANDISAQYGDLLNKNYCTGWNTFCPTDNNQPKSVPAYFTTPPNFIGDYYHFLPNSQAIQGSTNLLDIIFGLKPGSKLTVEIYSDPKKIGEATVGGDGNAKLNLTIPADTPAGFHTLILTGESPDSKMVKLYQFITVLSNNPKDLDDDGIDDKHDACPFVQPSSIDKDQDGTDDACDGSIGSPPSQLTANTADQPASFDSAHDRPVDDVKRPVKIDLWPTITRHANTGDRPSDGNFIAATVAIAGILLVIIVSYFITPKARRLP